MAWETKRGILCVLRGSALPVMLSFHGCAVIPSLHSATDGRRCTPQFVVYIGYPRARGWVVARSCHWCRLGQLNLKLVMM
jgi:hypothetical protein